MQVTVRGTGPAEPAPPQAQRHRVAVRHCPGTANSRRVAPRVVGLLLALAVVAAPLA